MEYHPGLSFDDIRVTGNEKLRWRCLDCNTVFLLSLLRANKYKHQLCPKCHGRRVTVPVSDSSISHLWNDTADPRIIGTGTHDIYQWSCGQHKWEKSAYHVLNNGGCVECLSQQREINNRRLKEEKENLKQELKKKKKKTKKTTPKPRPKQEPFPTQEHDEDKSSYKERCDDYRERRKNIGKIWVNDLSREVYSIPADINKSLVTTYPELSQLWNDTLRSADEVTSSSAYRANWKCSEGHSWKAYVYQLTQRWDKTGSGCPGCDQNNRSQGERELEEFISGLGVEYTSNDRTLIAPYEVDIYIPGKSIAIEFNGLYWHSEKSGKGRNYHRGKWEKAMDKGVQLITVWEDDWRERQSIVKSMISHKLGINSQKKVYARRTETVSLRYSEAKDFLDHHHIQGSTTGSLYLGLINNNDLLAVSVWRKHKDTLYLDRYATSVTVVGGMGKLLKAGKQWGRVNNCTQIVTFADHNVSDGGLYEKLGFSLDKKLPPDYSYIVKNSRVHKFNYRLARFRKDPDLVWVEGLSERELAELNKIYRIWDSGKTRYVMKI